MSEIADIYLGWDSRETVAYHVLSDSIIHRSSIPVRICPVGSRTIPDRIWWRPKGNHDSTEFSNTRFVIPALQDYRGWALWADCDMIALWDIADLWAQRDDDYAVMVVKHRQKTNESRKFLGALQTSYARKNWSSLMLLNCAHPATRRLTADYVNTAKGLDLHGFAWCEDRDIGEITGLWNVLAAPDLQHPEPIDWYDLKLLHYTLGGPWHGYEPEGGHYWLAALRAMLTGLNPCADAVIYQDGPGLLRVRGRYQRREPA